MKHFSLFVILTMFIGGMLACAPSNSELTIEDFMNIDHAEVSIECRSKIKAHSLPLNQINQQLNTSGLLCESYADNCMVLLLFKNIGKKRFDIYVDDELYPPTFYISKTNKNGDIYLFCGTIGDFRNIKTIKIFERENKQFADLTNLLLTNIKHFSICQKINRTIVIDDFQFELNEYIESDGTAFLRFDVNNPYYQKKIDICIIDEKKNTLFSNSYFLNNANGNGVCFFFKKDHLNSRYLQFKSKETNETLYEMLIL